MTPLVTTEFLAAELGKPDLVVFDATKYLPNEPKDGMTEFRAAHIPGARFFDMDHIADPDTDLPHMVPAAGRFARLVGALGVSNDTRVVFYDQKGLASAARGWWLMGLFGHDAAAVLDGGLPKWRAEGRALEAGDAPAPAPAVFRPHFRPTRLRGIGDMLHNLHAGAEQVPHPVSTEWVEESVLDTNPELVRTLSVKPPRGAGRVRLLRIGAGDPPVDLQPCGGTHVANTAEIGPVRVLKIENKGKQNRRITIALAP